MSEIISTFENTFLIKANFQHNLPLFNSRLDFANFLSKISKIIDKKNEGSTIKFRRLIDISIHRKKTSPELLEILERITQEKEKIITQGKDIEEVHIRCFITTAEDFLALLKLNETVVGSSVKSYYISTHNSLEVFKEKGYQILKENINDFEFLEYLLKEEILHPKNSRKYLKIFVSISEEDLLDIFFIKNNLLSLASNYEYKLKQTVQFICDDKISKELITNGYLNKYVNALSNKMKKCEEIYNKTKLLEFHEELLAYKSVLGEFKYIIDLIQNKFIPNEKLRCGQITDRINSLLLCDKKFDTNLNKISTASNKDLIDIFLDLEKYYTGAIFYTNIAYLNNFPNDFISRKMLCEYFLLFKKLNHQHKINRTFTIESNFYKEANNETKKAFLLFLKINVVSKVKVRICEINEDNNNKWYQKSFIHIRPSILDKENYSRVYIPEFNDSGNLIIKEIKKRQIEESMVNLISTNSQMYKLINEDDILDIINKMNLSEFDLKEVENEYQFNIESSTLI